jgi:putative RNA 2'-phosphotransferase
MKTHDIHVKRTAKFVAYILGRQPDEFGLVLDPNGFIPIKTLLKAIHEEEGWRHLRKGHLNELILNLNPAPIEIQEDAVRAVNREHLPAIQETKDLPKCLYLAVRQRAYPFILENGIRPNQNPYIILSSDSSMAERLGRRIDNHPVLITVQTENAQIRDSGFLQYGHHLFLTQFIPVGGFSGPALPKEKPAEVKRPAPKIDIKPKTPGSFFPDMTKVPSVHNKADKNKRSADKKAWQIERRKARKHKNR